MHRVLTVHHGKSFPNLEQFVHPDESQFESGLPVSLSMQSHLLPLVLGLHVYALLDMLDAGDIAILTTVGIEYVHFRLI